MFIQPEIRLIKRRSGLPHVGVLYVCVAQRTNALSITTSFAFSLVNFLVKLAVFQHQLEALFILILKLRNEMTRLGRLVCFDSRPLAKLRQPFVKCSVVALHVHVAGVDDDFVNVRQDCLLVIGIKCRVGLTPTRLNKLFILVREMHVLLQVIGHLSFVG